MIYRLVGTVLWCRPDKGPSFVAGKISCEGATHRCVSTDVTQVMSRTRYSWGGEGDDPNGPIWLCSQCEEEYTLLWDRVWDEYHGSLF